MSSSWPTCPFCGGSKVPLNYIGDVIGTVCMCRWQGPYTITPPGQPAPIKILTEDDVRRIVREELKNIFKELK